MIEVQSLKSADRAISEYRKCYVQRYRTQPVLDPEIPFQLFLKSLVNKFGEEKVIALIRFYLQSEGEYGCYAKKGHSPKTFQFEIEAINGLYSQRAYSASKNTQPSWDPMVQFYSTCISSDCGKTTSITCKGSEMEKYVHNVACETCEIG